MRDCLNHGRARGDEFRVVEEDSFPSMEVSSFCFHVFCGVSVLSFSPFLPPYGVGLGGRQLDKLPHLARLSHSHAPLKKGGVCENLSRRCSRLNFMADFAVKTSRVNLMLPRSSWPVVVAGIG
jgi:hypothetical protein